MICYHRIEFSEGTDNKTSALKEGGVCHYWYFLSYSFELQTNVCSRCQDLLMMSLNLSDIAILSIKGSNYCQIISLISKNEAINLLRNTALTEKSRTFQIKKYIPFF